MSTSLPGNLILLNCGPTLDFRCSALRTSQEINNGRCNGNFSGVLSPSFPRPEVQNYSSKELFRLLSHRGKVHIVSR